MAYATYTICARYLGQSYFTVEQAGKKSQAVQFAQSVESEYDRVWIERIMPDMTKRRWYPDGSRV